MLRRRWSWRERDRRIAAERARDGANEKRQELIAQLTERHRDDLLLFIRPGFGRFTCHSLNEEIARYEYKIKMVQDVEAVAFADTPQNRAVCQAVVEMDTITGWWDDLPVKLQTDLEFIRGLRCMSFSMAQALLERLPLLRSDMAYWTVLVEKVVRLRELWANYAAFGSIRNSSELSLKACQVDASIVSLVGAPLLADRSFLEALLLDRQPMSLAHVPLAVLEDFPDIVVQAFAALAQNIDPSLAHVPQSVLDEFPDYESFGLANEFSLQASDPVRYGSRQAAKVAINISRSERIFGERTHVLAWFQSGLPVVRGVDALSQWIEDRQICSLIAKNCISDQLCQFSFAIMAPVSLRSDKQFMVRMIAHRPCLIKTVASVSLKRDFDVLLQTFGHPHYCRRQLPAFSIESISQFRWWLLDGLNQHKIFHSVFLLGMACTESPLSLLDQGHETSERHKRRIAEYVHASVVVGDIASFRRAKRNVEEWLRDDLLARAG